MFCIPTFCCSVCRTDLLLIRGVVWPPEILTTLKLAHRTPAGSMIIPGLAVCTLFPTPIILLVDHAIFSIWTNRRSVAIVGEGWVDDGAEAELTTSRCPGIAGAVGEGFGEGELPPHAVENGGAGGAASDFVAGVKGLDGGDVGETGGLKYGSIHLNGWRTEGRIGGYGGGRVGCASLGLSSGQWLVSDGEGRRTT